MTLKLLKVKAIPATDLAVISSKSAEEQRRRLRNFALHVPDKSYQAARAVRKAFFRMRHPLFTLPRESLKTIEDAVRGLASPISLPMCLEVVRSVYDFTSGRDIVGEEIDHIPLRLDQDRAVKANIGFYVVENGRAFIPVIEPRLNAGFDERSISVFCSIVRQIYCFGDYEDLAIEVWECSRRSGKVLRAINVTRDDKLERLSREELTSLFSVTYGIYKEVVDQLNADRMRGKVADTSGQTTFFDDEGFP